LDAEGQDRAWRWENGEFTDLGSLVGGISEAYEINENGQVIGKALIETGHFHAFRYSDQQGMIDLQTLPEAVSSVALAINDVGMVAGVWRDAEGVGRAFRYTDHEGMVDLGGEGVLSGVGGMRINNAGLVTGAVLSRLPDVPTLRPFIWNPVSGFHFVDESLTTSLDWASLTAVDINDQGEFLIRGVDVNVSKSAVLTQAGDVFGDGDGDGDVDLADFAELQLCFSGAGNSFDANGVVTHTVDVGPGFSYFPSMSTIEAGDTIHWDWVDGLHNVESGIGGTHDSNFRSGAPINNPSMSFEVTFDGAFLADQPMPNNAYPYYCAVHVGFGMTGMVQVVEHPCSRFDGDVDGDVDVDDVDAFQDAFTGP
jgi:probable HAF family extracellular repeat protein